MKNYNLVYSYICNISKLSDVLLKLNEHDYCGGWKIKSVNITNNQTRACIIAKRCESNFLIEQRVDKLCQEIKSEAQISLDHLRENYDVAISVFREEPTGVYLEKLNEKLKAKYEQSLGVEQ